MQKRFVQEAENLSCKIHSPNGKKDTAWILSEIISTDQRVSAWDWDQIPFPRLEHFLSDKGIELAPPDDPEVRVGITGVNAAMAATGSIVLDRRKGRHNSPSLLPPVHIAIITLDQILPNLEAWVAQQRLDNLVEFQKTGNTMVISGPSRTADIGMELILGMHLLYRHSSFLVIR